MNVLLTGGMGYIGSHIAVALSQSVHQVVLYDNLSNSNHSVLAGLDQITGKRMFFVEGDVRDTEKLINVLSAHEIDAVIHLAGLKSVGESVENPVEYYSNNVHGTISLLHAMQTQEIKSLVFSSSATVYGQPQYLPVDENHPTSATNPYGRCKLHVEEMLSDIAASDPCWAVACLRYFNPVGAHSSGLIGESPMGVPNNLMPYIARVASGACTELRVFGGDYPTPDGTGVRDYIHVTDLAQGHVAALKYISQTVGWHAINLGSGKGYSVLDMVSAFERISGCKIPYRVVGRREGDVAACYANPTKAAELLNWVTRLNLDDMCASTWRFEKSAQNK